MSSENVQEGELNEPAKAEEFFAEDSAQRFSTNGRSGLVRVGPGEFLREVLAFKFGGTSLLGAERMMHAASIVHSSAQDCPVVVIVSAMKGVTDQLLAIGTALENGKIVAARKEAEALVEEHLAVLSALQLDEDDDLRVRREMQSLCRDLLHDVGSQFIPLAGHDELLDRLASYGERLSARLFSAALEKSEVVSVPVTSSDFVRTCGTFRDARPDLLETRERGRAVLLPLLADGVVPVVTGFIGATLDGRITTLGRNSSDFSGAIIAHVVDADELIIWTDVDGIYTANPREDEEARLLHEMSYDDAHALAKSGAKVLHASVLPLAAETEMVVWVRNTFNPAGRGTRIGPRADLSTASLAPSSCEGGK
jgi:aspartokinase/homoserine dehydrogenase 1